jgi:hypothetical protein
MESNHTEANSNATTKQTSWGFLCIWGSFLVFEILTLLIGLAIWMIAHGIYLITSRLVLYWKPARTLAMRTMKIQNAEYFVVPAMTWWRYISVGMYITIGSVMVYFGFKTLLASGFLNQNLIYLLIQ